ncbi:MAG: adenylate/guanylate cyclase domain-containing protein [Chloroflexota bacterium]|nr:adenylate/guanylate cyclase domain-containing protein [Chloroflexota bacterium]
MATLPQGTVTFLFTDIEGSTRLVQTLGSSYREVLETHQLLLRQAFASGVEVATQGDSFFVVFESASEAVAAAVAAQRSLASRPWPRDVVVRVRIGLHTGQGTLGADSYVGFDVHRAARIAAAGHGGQVLLSETTRALVRRELPAGVTVRDLGEHRLKDLALPERIFQLVIDGLATDFPALQSADDQRSNLPAQLTSFVGREAELAELKALARAHRLVTVIGTGGTGKTRLMIQVANEMLAEQPDGIWLVELAPLSDPEAVTLAIARGLGIRNDSGRPLIETLTDFLRTKELLLLLDNCEHLIGAVADLAERILAAAPTVSILTTSREALGIAGERVFQVPSLGLPALPHGLHEHGQATERWLREARAAEAVRLFVDRATAALPSFSLTAAEAPAVVEICRRLDGIPLAIELAAARVPLLSVHEIAQRLGDRFRLLTGGRRTALPRQQTLQALIDWSWDLLGDDERRLLRRLSVFTGGCTIEAAAAVTGLPDEPMTGDDPSLDTLEVLGRLVGRSLVVVDRSAATRYRLLETIRQYARDRLLEAAEGSVVRERHLRFYLDLALRAEPELQGPGIVTWLALLDADADNLRAAVNWSLEADPPAGVRLCLALALYWRMRSVTEGLEYLGRAADAARSLPDGAPTGDGEKDTLVARLLAAAANASWMAGSAAIGRPWAEESLRRARELDDPRALAEALIAMSMTTVFVGEADGVLEWTDEALRLAETIGAWSSIAFLQAGLAQWNVENSDHRAAEARLASATTAAERSGNPEAIAFTALSRGRMDGFAGRLPEARRAFASAIEGYEQLDDEGMMLVARSDLAHALRLNGIAGEAVDIYRRTLHAWQHAGNRGAIANQLESVAFVALERDEAGRAARLLGAAEAIREDARAPMLSWERFEYDRAVEALRHRLDADDLASALADGRRLGVDAAVAEALEGL